MTSAVSGLSATLKQQHEQIKSMMATVVDDGGDRQRAFDEFRRFLTAHEAAEEQCIHPAAQQDHGKVAEVADQRVQEEDKAGQMIAQLEAMDIDSAEFATTFGQLAQAVIAHAEAEEHQELPLLDGVVDQQQLTTMTEALGQVQQIADDSAEMSSASFQDMLAAATQQLRQT